MAYNIYIFDQTEWSVTFRIGRPTSLKKWASNALVFNLSLFDMRTGEICDYVKAENGIAGKDRYTEIVKVGACECAGYSNAIIKGVVSIQAPLGGSRTRNGIGLTASGKVIIAQSSHKVTERAFAEAVNAFIKAQKETVDMFILQDGGGSTGEYSGLSRLSFSPEGGRPVPAVTIVKSLYRPVFPCVERVLSKGKKGDDVKLLQTVLGGIEADGIFGNGTRSRVQQAQRAFGLIADGIAGPLTLKALGLR